MPLGSHNYQTKQSRITIATTTIRIFIRILIRMLIRIGCKFLNKIIYWRIWLITLGEIHWKTIREILITRISKGMIIKLQLGKSKVVRMLILSRINKWILVVVNRVDRVNRGQWVWRIDIMNRCRDWDRVINSRRW